MADNRARMLALAKVLIAAAWADGEITEGEKNCLKDLIFHLSDTGVQLSAQEWEMLEMYMESPVGPEERARLVADLQDAIRTSAERQYVLDALQQMASADGAVNEEEQRVLREIARGVEEADVGVVDALNRLLGGAMSRRGAALANAPNRDVYFEDFLKNKVYYSLRRELAEEGRSLDLSDEELRRLGLMGGLMARVAHVDREVSEEERQAMVQAIEETLGINRETARYVADAALSSTDENYDYYRMTREFGTTTSIEERRRFLILLFRIAAADNGISFDETEEIRTIARGINVSHQDFINAKMAVLER